MKSKRIKKGLCPHCSKVLLNGKCPDRITIRTLVSWVPTNQNLYDAMIASKCSTKDLAVAVGVSQRTITRWLFEGAKPRYPERAELAANYLNTSVDELFRNFNK
jgi:DNA-binding XRE family transcriptional regulator